MMMSKLADVVVKLKPSMISIIIMDSNMNFFITTTTSNNYNNNNNIVYFNYYYYWWWLFRQVSRERRKVESGF